MPKGPFIPSEFTPTQWSTVEEKATFGNTLLHFIDSGFRETLFTKKFYDRLMNTFGHIAHYSREGFFSEWFTNEVDRLRFLQHLLQWPCYGDPTFTFCDVERAVQREVRSRNYFRRQQEVVAEAVRNAEMATLERLEAKYRKPQRESEREEVLPPSTPQAKVQPSPVVSAAAQGTLF